MPPRIRSLLPRLPYDRGSGKKTNRAGDAPRVFREFVETLQRLDAPGRTPKRTGARLAGRRRGYAGNGHRRPGKKAKLAQ
jgi:hypothetical protein